MATVYLALGSNVGDSKDFICRAQQQLAQILDQTVSAPLYRSKAFGFQDQADFLNTVVCGQTSLSPKQLLGKVKTIEKQLGRQERFRWGPREIDIDIILYDDYVIEEPELTIPHSGLAERDFVLRPLCDLCGDAVDPRSGNAIKTLLELIPPANRTILPAQG